MSQVRTLLFALLLPVLVLPDGIVVCLHRLLGEQVAKSCCTKCCSSPLDSAAPAALELKNAGCRDCCIALPATERSLTPTSKKVADPTLALPDAALAALPCVIAPALPLANRVLARAQGRRPPPLVPIALPLRL